MKDFFAKVIHLAAGAAQHSKEEHGETFHFILIGIDPDDSSVHVAGTVADPFVAARVTSMATRQLMASGDVVKVPVDVAIRVPAGGDGPPPKKEN